MDGEQLLLVESLEDLRSTPVEDRLHQRRKLYHSAPFRFGAIGLVRARSRVVYAPGP